MADDYGDDGGWSINKGGISVHRRRGQWEDVGLNSRPFAVP